MRIDSAFPSKYLKAADLMNKQVSVRISHVDMENIGDGELKAILYFKDKEKGMVLNKTNSNAISSAYGNETDEWADQPIILFEAMVDYQGKTVPAIRVKIPGRGRSKAPANTMAEELDDTVPF